MIGKGRKYTQAEKINRLLILLAVITFLSIVVLLLLPGRGPWKEVVTGEQPSYETPEPSPVRYAIEEGVREKRTPEATRAPSVTTPVPGRGKLAFVIDDAGNSLEDLKPFVESGLPMTIAVLPGLRNSLKAAEMVANAGMELILHLPMEATNGYNPGPGAIYSSMNEKEILRVIEEDFSSVQGARGANNHMGSLGTSDHRIMDIVLGYMKDRGKLFLDSRTTSETVAREYARQYGVPFAERDIFPDNETDNGYIVGQIKKGIELALEKGSAIMIGHAHNVEVIRAMKTLAPDFKKAGLELVFLSKLVR